MKMLSIDVGIKNLSYCLFEIPIIDNNTTDITNSNIAILKWDNIDLSGKTESKCTENHKNGLCDKPAKFTKNGKCYCLKHSKQQLFLQPTPELKTSYINKQKIQKLIEISNKYSINCDHPITKIKLMERINNFIIDRCFNIIGKTNASKVDLVTIGRNIQHNFDKLFFDTSIELIIIENQIGPIANKMKTIQGMISQYFIMKDNNIKIEFISASNKLKDFIAQETEMYCKLNYKQRKNLGIKTCLDIITKDNRFKDWELFFNNHSKKDDLSDAFLQGIWFIKHKILPIQHTI